MMMDDDKHYDMYGKTKEDMDGLLNSPMADVGGKYLVAISLLSDVQEAMSMNPQFVSRLHQEINVAKYVMRQAWEDNEMLKKALDNVDALSVEEHEELHRGEWDD
jgi:hypothetical protein